MSRIDDRSRDDCGPRSARVTPSWRARPFARVASAVGAALLLTGCDAWDRFAERFAVTLAIFFTALLAPMALAAAAALQAGAKKTPAVSEVVVAWFLANGASFLIGILDQFLRDLVRHASWAIAIPSLGIPVAAWALVASDRLARARAAPPWVRYALATGGVAYVVWIALVTARGARLL